MIMMMMLTAAAMLITKDEEKRRQYEKGRPRVAHTSMHAILAAFADFTMDVCLQQQNTGQLVN